MKNKPNTIYLQVEEPTEDFKQLSEVTWHNKRLNKSDLEYRLVEKRKVGLPKHQELFEYLASELDAICLESNLIDIIEIVLREEGKPSEVELKKYTIEDIELCVEHWGLCKVEAPYIEKFLNEKLSSKELLDNCPKGCDCNPNECNGEKN